MRIATVHILLDVTTDGEADDWCSETLTSLDHVVDWSHAHRQGDAFFEPPSQAGASRKRSELTVYYTQSSKYGEGDFLWACPLLAR